MNPFRNFLAATAIVGLVGAGAALSSGPSTAQAGPTPTQLTDSSIPDVAERVVDSVVNISSKSVTAGPASFDPFFTDPDSPDWGQPSMRQQMSKGSGVVVTPGGRILTNAHVVRGAKEITVTLHDGTDFTAKVIGTDPKADLAVIQLEGKIPVLKPLVFGDSHKLRLGEVVLAVGDPFGVGKSVTMGIVSAKGRSSMGIEEYEDFIQTDAAINPGNSGGALVNLKGELVGINTAIASPTGGYAGIGYAIPSNMASPIMDMLVKDGKVSRGYLGVNIATVTAQLAQQHKLGASRGALIAGVQDGSPASKAGLVEGDVVTAINGAEVRSSEVLHNLIATYKPGTTVDLEVARKTSGRTVIKAKLGEAPADTTTNQLPTRQRQLRRR
jgi:Do/DeqQ family serine protease